MNRFLSVRHTDNERRAWEQAAGGHRRLSSWVRDTLNRAANQTPSSFRSDCPDKQLHIRGRRCLTCHGDH